MDIEKLTGLVTLLIALSVASERLVEILKGVIPFLGQEFTDDAKKEGRSRSALQFLAVLAGVVTALLAKPVLGDAIPQAMQNPTGVLALGLLASGGSGFWNSILGYFMQVKELKKAIAKQEQKREPGEPQRPAVAAAGAHG